MGSSVAAVIREIIVTGQVDICLEDPKRAQIIVGIKAV